MKKISSKRITTRLTGAAAKQGIIIEKKGAAYKKGARTISATVDVANQGIDFIDTVVKKGEAVLEKTKARIHAATAPKK